MLYCQQNHWICCKNIIYIVFLNEIKLKLETRISFICVRVRLDAACLVINELISVSQSRAHCNNFPFKLTKSHLVKNTLCNICVDTAEVPPPYFWMFIDWYAFSPMQIMRHCHSVHATFKLKHVMHVWHLIKQNVWIYNRVGNLWLIDKSNVTHQVSQPLPTNDRYKIRHIIRDHLSAEKNSHHNSFLLAI